LLSTTRQCKIKKNINVIHVKNVFEAMKYKSIGHEDCSRITKNDLLIYDAISSGKPISYLYKFFDKVRVDQLISYRSKLHELKKLPLIRQRTIEWLDARKTRLTASDLEDAIKSNNIKLAKKKAGITPDTTNYTTIAPLKWGTMFEDMAMRCYSQDRNDIPVSEFGLIIDKAQEHFGASPDGINDLGVMIEIKCPFTREIIDGKIPSKYYMQIQGQLATCCLEECDYIECEFIPYDSVYKYIDDIENNYNDMKINHGVIAEYKDTYSGEYAYLYSKPYLTASHALYDIEKQVHQNKKDNLEYLKLTPWRLEKMNVQKVYFDKELWIETVPKINSFWEKVEQCKTLPKEEPKIKQKIAFIDDDEDD
jgi:putative phage-type endonuclease